VKIDEAGGYQQAARIDDAFAIMRSELRTDFGDGFSGDPDVRTDRFAAVAVRDGAALYENAGHRALTYLLPTWGLGPFWQAHKKMGRSASNAVADQSTNRLPHADI
jgi:hypothetical protein